MADSRWVRVDMATHTHRQMTAESLRKAQGLCEQVLHRDPNLTDAVPMVSLIVVDQALPGANGVVHNDTNNVSGPSFHSISSRTFAESTCCRKEMALSSAKVHTCAILTSQGAPAFLCFQVCFPSATTVSPSAARRSTIAASWGKHWHPTFGTCSHAGNERTS